MAVARRPPNSECPLCGTSASQSASLLCGVDGRNYRRCENCWLIFGATRDLPTHVTAMKHYQLHENHIGNNGYVSFLQRAINVVSERLDLRMRVLDYGCGPGAVLCELVRNLGLECENYDPVFVPMLPDGPFGLIFATECFEHFTHPAQELNRLGGLLDKSGWLVVMTECWKDLGSFSRWYYTGDPTHVIYFHDRTFDYIAEHWHYERIPTMDPRVHLLHRV